MSDPKSTSVATLPNLLSLSRLPLGVVFWLALGPTQTHGFLALGVMGLAAITDVLDGYIARRRGTDSSGTGSWLDPICDKLFVGAILAALHFERGVSLGLLALIVSRELIQLPMALTYRMIPTLRHWLRYDFRASLLGKAATVAQFLAIAALILGLPAQGLAILAFAVGIIALGDYVRRAILIGRNRLHEPEEKK
jgi:cardiolipin synthase